MDFPSRISVIIPTHNRGEFVDRAIRSVLAQTYSAAEIIVVDDCSSDNTPQVLAEFGQAITVVRTSANIERGAARNLGAAHAQGDHLAFLDSDDEWKPLKLEAQVAATKHADASVTGAEIVDAEGASLRTYTPPRDAARRIAVQNVCFAAPSSLIIRADTFAHVGGFPADREMQGSEDWAFLVLLVRRGYVLETIPDSLVRYRVHPSNSTNAPDTFAGSMPAALRWMDEQGLLRSGELRRARARAACIIGSAYAARGDTRTGAAWAVRAIAAGAPIEAGRAIALTLAHAVKAKLWRTSGCPTWWAAARGRFRQASVRRERRKRRTDRPDA